MRAKNFHLILLLGVLSAWQCPSARAQTPGQMTQFMMSQPRVDISAPVTASASFDPPLVRPGEKSIYRVTFNATSDASAVAVRWPEPMPVPRALKLRLGASGHNVQMAGGAMQMFSTFNYDARAAEPGIFTIPEYTVEVYGRPVAVPAAQLEVRDTLPEPHEPARQLILEPSKTNVFVGETFPVRVLMPGNASNRIEGISQMDLTGDGFIMERNSSSQSIQMLDVNGRRTPTYIYETLVTPITPGRLALAAQGFSGGLQFGGTIVISGQVTIPGGRAQYLLLNSEPVMINVSPLPVENELPGFTGAIGSYACAPPRIGTNTVKIGEPVQLTVFIRGQKNLDRINPPPPPRVPGWQIFPAVRGGIVAGSGTVNPAASFNYTLIPVTAEVRATPAIPFSCFDPAQGKYIDLTIPSVPVTVVAGGMSAPADSSLMTSETPPVPEEISGLSQAAQTPGRTADSLVPLQLRAWFPLVQLLPVVGFCGLWLWDRRRRFLEQHPEIVRRRQARREMRREMRRLEMAASSGDIAGFTRSAIKSLQIASAPHYPAEPRALVCGDVLKILPATERQGKSGETVRQFFAVADAGAFAVTPGNNFDLLAAKASLQEILLKLEAQL